MEVAKAFRAASGRKVPYELVDRRPGGCGFMLCEYKCGRQILGWRAVHGIERMCADHWRWQSMNRNGLLEGCDDAIGSVRGTAGF